jgi:hypothetical protein
MPLRVLIAASCAAFAAAGASSITDEIIGNSTQSSPSNPRAGSIGDSLHANLDVAPHWSMSAGAMLSFEGDADGTRTEFGNSSSTISQFTLGADYHPGENWSFGLSLNGSPKSTIFAGTSFTGPNAKGVEVPVDALIQSQTSELSATLDIGYDTAGESDLEWSFGLASTFTHLDTNQSVTEAHFNNTAAVVGPAEIKAACERNGPRCVKGLLTALDETPDSLDSEHFSGNATATIERDTDVTLTLDWYHYDQDPAEIGFFSLVEAGHAGLGVPIAPLHYLVKPELQHRYGAFSIRFWVQAGRYAQGTGQTTAGLGAKAQYKFSSAWRMWLTVTGQNDVDEAGESTRSGGLALGAGYRW